MLQAVCSPLHSTLLRSMSLNSLLLDDISPIRLRTGLTCLRIQGDNLRGRRSLTVLSPLRLLSTLSFRYCPLSTLVALEDLEIHGNHGVLDLVTRLTKVDIGYCLGVTDVAPLATLGALSHLETFGSVLVITSTTFSVLL